MISIFLLYLQGCYDEIVHYIQGHALMIGGIAIAAIVVMVIYPLSFCNDLRPASVIAGSVFVQTSPWLFLCLLLLFYSFSVSYLECVYAGPSGAEDTDIDLVE